MRKLIAAVLGTVATFVMLFGAGMTSWAIVALGAALLVLAIGLVAVTAVRTGSRAWVTGSAHVHQVSEPPAAYAFGRCELQIVIDAPGLPARSVKVIDPRVPVAKWPLVGQQLPIKVAIDDQRHVRILWDEAPTHAETAARTSSRTADLDEFGGLDDDLLIEQDAPPWLRRDPDDEFPPPAAGEPVTEDLTDDLSGLRDEPVVLHQGPGGTIVLEGTLVESAPVPPLPRRPRPSPGPRPERTAPEPTAPVDPASEATAGSSATASAAPSSAAPPSAAPPSAAASAGPPPAARTVPRPASPADDFDLDLPIDDPGPRLRPDGGSRPDAPRTGPARRRQSNLDPADPDLFGPDLSDPDPGVPGRVDADLSGPDLSDLELIDPAREGPAEPDEEPAPRETPADPTGAPAGPAGAATTAAGTARPGDAPAPAGPISGVGITLLVTNLDRSIAFYRDKLGFHEIDGGRGNAVLASGTTRLVLRTIPEVAPINRRLVHLNLEVADVEAAYQEVKARGVSFTSSPRAVNRGEKMELWAAAFRDPDGHGVALTQWRDRVAS